MRARDNPYGPDGFDTLAPLIPIGHVPPFQWIDTVAVFSGGFQNKHGAFRAGELAKSQKGHHYGFIEKGVVMVSPVEELATFIMYQDGSVELKRWTAKDAEKLPRIRHLRQNGVPLVQRDENGNGIPGKWVKHRREGNWSGSVDKSLRTVRAGACTIATKQEDFLVYAYFSGATPNAMARVFQAYGCNAAIHLDMNSPGQAYAGLFRQKSDAVKFDIELLVKDMNQYMGGSGITPRYLIKPDYKDFFYIMKRK